MRVADTMTFVTVCAGSESIARPRRRAAKDIEGSGPVVDAVLKFLCAEVHITIATVGMENLVAGASWFPVCGVPSMAYSVSFSVTT